MSTTAHDSTLGTPAASTAADARGARATGFERLLPAARDDGTGEPHRARLISALSLGLVGLCVLGCVQVVLLAPAQVAVPLLEVIGATVLAFAVAYAAARAGRTDLAGAIIVATQIVATSAAYLASGIARLPGASCASWLSLALLTANAVFGPRAVLAVGAIAVLALTCVEAAAGAAVQTIAEGGLVLAGITMAIFVYTRHRDRVEALRQGVLRRRNEELEQLRTTLEERVQERTAALESTAASLRASAETLASNQALLIRSEKMAAVGRLTAGFAHELASPLGAVVASLDVLRDLCGEYARAIGDADVTDEDHRAIADDMVRTTSLSYLAAQRAVTFVRGIRAHTRDPGAMATERFDVASIAHEVTALLAYPARAAKVQLEVRCEGGPILVKGVPSRLNQAITNLVQNAIDATGETGRGGNVVVHVGSNDGSVVVRVEDDGPGIRAEVLPHVFEPLFTTKRYGLGTGLGLAIVAQIVRDELDGDVSIETNVGAGTAFVIRLPQLGSAGGP